jgi:D-amino-acid dehydrogenase
MHVVVLGAGVVGLSSAWYLARAGHQVTVVEREAEVARGASHANGGGLCPGFAGPWPAPGMPAKAVRWLFQPNAPLSLGRGIRPADGPWLYHFARHCTPEAFHKSKARMQRIAHYSHACLLALNKELGFADEYAFRPTGVLQVFRDEETLRKIETHALPLLREYEVAHRLVGQDELVGIEPALADSHRLFVGGLLLSGDATGDAHRFSVALHARLAREGVAFHFGHAAKGLDTVGGRIAGVSLANGQRIGADAVVVAQGAESGALVKPLGLNLSIRPVKGFSLTADLRDGVAPTPEVAVMDEANKTFFARIGERVRVAGMAEITGFDRSLPEGRKAFLREQLEEIYPQRLQFDKADFWAGFRPMTWDGPPLIGATPVPGLYLNAGHGSNGWTQACGSARILADLVSGETPEIEVGDLCFGRNN